LIRTIVLLNTAAETGLIEEIGAVGGRTKSTGGNPLGPVASIQEKEARPSTSRRNGLSAGQRTCGAPPRAWLTALTLAGDSSFGSLNEDACEFSERKFEHGTSFPVAAAIGNDSPETATEPVLELLDGFPADSIQVAAVHTLSQ